MTRRVKIGNVEIGGGAPVAIQSMTTADTKDTDAVCAQISALCDAGCEIVRLAAYDVDAAKNIKNIKDRVDVPIVADVHFDYKIAIAAIEAGADKVRINPGNIGDERRIAAVADAARMHGVPIRVGANTGSLKDSSGDRAEALVKSALENIELLEKQGFYDIVVSLKSSDAAQTVAAYRKMSALRDYPLHLGVTEAGTLNSSMVKSSIGIGALLIDGIGDTIRASVTGDPVSEIALAKDILRYSGVRSFGCEVIACPTCARTKIDIEKLAKEVERRTSHIDKNIKIAVMGCIVNGPGEAKDADIGIAGGDGVGVLFKKGEFLGKYPEDKLIDALMDNIEEMVR